MREFSRLLIPPREDPRLAQSITLTTLFFFLGVALLYGFANLAISSHFVFKLIGAGLLLVSLALALIHLVRFFSSRYFTWIGLGLGLLLLSLLLYLLTISAAVCHQLTSKWGVLVFGVAGFSSTCYGVMSWLDAYTPGLSEQSDTQTTTCGSTPTGNDTVTAVTNLILVVVAFLSIFAIVNELVILSWSRPCQVG